MKSISKHADWLSLIEVSGPFLTVSMLEKAFPQGLEAVETPRRQKLRAAYEEWREAVDLKDNLLPELHREWVRLVLTEVLEYDHESLVYAGDWSGDLPSVSSQENAGLFSPDWIIRSPADGKPRQFIAVLPPNTDLESVQRGDGWPVSLKERMTLLCRAYGIRVGYLTDGERWMLVNAPVGSTSSQASWYARLWFQEPITLKAFQSLLGVRRCFGPAEDTLESLLEESLKHQEEVTDSLGEQVRRAVEVLVQCLDKADEDRNRELLNNVNPSELYEAGLTVMMRLVFVLCAEERGLLLLGDPVYDQCYAVSTLRGQLAEEADRHGPEVLDRRHDAWARLLAVFRAVYGGIEHESLRMPALGGSLFDPDRFPFLEGRAKGTRWRNTSAAPLPIDNRTVLLLLNSLQILEQSGGALLLSYRALDVEQIGHVYEGLLEHTVARVPHVTLGLQGSQKAKNPNVALSELESARLEGEAALVRLVQDVTARSESAIRNNLSKPADDTIFIRVIGVCGGDTTLAERIRPFTNLLRTDAWEDPIVYRDNSFMVTLGADRRETGTHYTPKSLTESIVTTTLEPLVYVGPAEGNAREEWKLKSPSEILDLKVCDPAMGSGAFLVQACRYLGEKLVEAWLREESIGKSITVNGVTLDQLGSEEPLSTQLDERLTIARRLVAERCLYGVDINPLAVELAKLSIWLVTLAKGRPFGFLDHNLRSGDSLLGIHRLEQLTQLRINPLSGQQYQLRIFGKNIEASVNEAIELRKQLRDTTIRDIKSVESMTKLDHEVRKKLEIIELIADAMMGEALRSEGNYRKLNSYLDQLSIIASEALNGKLDSRIQIEQMSISNLENVVSKKASNRKAFHWIIEFPEVFQRKQNGFDALIGNPPYINAVEMYSGPFSELLKKFFTKHYLSASGSYDIYVLFYERSASLSGASSVIGLLIPNKVLSSEYAESLRNIISNQLRLYALQDYSNANAFAASVYPIAFISSKPSVEVPALIIDKNGAITAQASQLSLKNTPKLLWAYLLTEYAELLTKALENTTNLEIYFDVVGAATVSEAYEISPFVQSNEEKAIPKGHSKFVVSGNIRPYQTTWLDSPVQYLKNRYRFPSVPINNLPTKRRIQSSSPKIIISGMSKRPTAFFDKNGEYCAGKSTVLVLNEKKNVSLSILEDILNSKIAALIYLGLYGGLALSGGYLRFGPPQIAAFPIPNTINTVANELRVSEHVISELYGINSSEVDYYFERVFGSGAHVISPELECEE